MLSLKSKHEEWTSCLLTICLNVISFSWYLLVFTPSHLPAIDEAQKESNKRGELERSPNKRREVAPVRGPQFWLDGFWCSGMPVECSPWWWFQIFCIFTPTWRNDPIWRILYFSNGLRPPTSHPSTVRKCFIGRVFAIIPYSWNHLTSATILSSVHLTFPCLLGLRVSAYDAPFPMFNPPATEEEQRPGSLCFLQGELCERWMEIQTDNIRFQNQTYSRSTVFNIVGKCC